MKKKLASGIYVNADDYYALLVWKNHNMNSFLEFAYENKFPEHSINSLNQKQFNDLAKFALKK